MNKNNLKKVTYGVSKALIAASPIIALSALDANAAFDIDAGMKAATDPLKNMINTYYPVGLFVSGVAGAFLQPQGDLKDRTIGFGKGAAMGGVVMAGVKAGLGV